MESWNIPEGTPFFLSWHPFVSISARVDVWRADFSDVPCRIIESLVNHDSGTSKKKYFSQLGEMQVMEKFSPRALHTESDCPSFFNMFPTYAPQLSLDVLPVPPLLQAEAHIQTSDPSTEGPPLPLCLLLQE